MHAACERGPRERQRGDDGRLRAELSGRRATTVIQPAASAARSSVLGPAALRPDEKRRRRGASSGAETARRAGRAGTGVPPERRRARSRGRRVPRRAASGPAPHCLAASRDHAREARRERARSPATDCVRSLTTIVSVAAPSSVDFSAIHDKPFGAHRGGEDVDRRERVRRRLDDPRDADLERAAAGARDRALGLAAAAVDEDDGVAGREPPRAGMRDVRACETEGLARPRAADLRRSAREAQTCPLLLPSGARRASSGRSASARARPAPAPRVTPDRMTRPVRPARARIRPASGRISSASMLASTRSKAPATAASGPAYEVHPPAERVAAQVLPRDEDGLGVRVEADRARARRGPPRRAPGRPSRSPRRARERPASSSSSRASEREPRRLVRAGAEGARGRQPKRDPSGRRLGVARRRPDRSRDAGRP